MKNSNCKSDLHVVISSENLDNSTYDCLQTGHYKILVGRYVINVIFNIKSSIIYKKVFVT
jgi:hypothetical protein